MRYTRRMEPNYKDKVILAIAAHPDDLEFGCSGTMAKWISQGATGYYCLLTDGSKGSEDMSITNAQLASIRQKEQLAAGKHLGLKDVFFMEETDGELQNTVEIRKKLVKLIRQIKPDVVITLDPTFYYDEERGYINHPDHRTAGQIALECIFPFARNGRTFPELLDEGLEIHKVQDVYLINFGKASTWIDISDHIDTKLKSIKEHTSQYEDFDDLLKWVKERASHGGENVSGKYAEGFIKIAIKS